MNQVDTSTLLQAIEQGQDKQVQDMIMAGADLNEASANGWTPLMVAVLRDAQEVAELLLTKGADVNRVTSSQENPARTALVVAVRNGRAAMVELLLKYGAEVGPAQAGMPSALELVKRLPPRPEHNEQRQQIMKMLELRENVRTALVTT